MDIHAQSLAYAEEWLNELAHASVMSKDQPLTPRTIDRYRDCVIGRVKRRTQTSVPLLEWWNEEAPGEPIWTITREAMLGWFFRDVRDGAGGTKEPSSSEVNNRRSAALNFFRWLDVVHEIRVHRSVSMYTIPTEDRSDVRRKDVKMNPLLDGVFSTIWATTSDVAFNPPPASRLRRPDLDDLVWLGQGAFMTMRIDEIADLRPDGVDLERRTATFIGKGRKLRTVPYGELMEDWSYLPHLGRIPEEWLKRFEDLVARRQEDAERYPPKSVDDTPWWVWPHTEGQMRPHRDNTRKVVWTPSANDRDRFSKRWKRMMREAGFQGTGYTPHQLRHLASTNMWRAGTPWLRIVTVMGHEDADTTRHAYSEFSNDFNRERARNERLRGLASD